MSRRKRNKSETQESVPSFHVSLIKGKLKAKNRKKGSNGRLIMAVNSQNPNGLALLRHTYQLTIIWQVYYNMYIFIDSKVT